jgi:acyl carrier protein
MGGTMRDRIIGIMKNIFDMNVIAEDVSQENCIEWDSMHHLQLVVELENEFAISFTPEEIALMTDFTTVEKVIISKIL